MVDIVGSGFSTLALPPALRQNFFVYKQSTTRILQFLFSENGDHQQLLVKYKTRQILSQARTVAQKSISPSEEVNSAFKIAIVYRRRLTEYYESLPDQTQTTLNATKQHKRFNKVLCQSWAALCPEVIASYKKSASNANLSEKEPMITPKEPVSTVRTIVETSDDDEDGDEDELKGLSRAIQEEPDYTELQDTSPPDVPDGQNPPRIEDDLLEEFMEMHLRLLEVQELVASVKQFWEEVATGKMNMTLAGFLTNWAFNALRGKIRFWSELFDNHFELVAQYEKLRDAFGTDSAPTTPLAATQQDTLSKKLQAQYFTEGLGLYWPVQPISQAREFMLAQIKIIPIWDYFPAPEYKSESYSHEDIAKARKSMSDKFLSSFEEDAFDPAENVEHIPEKFRNLQRVACLIFGDITSYINRMEPSTKEFLPGLSQNGTSNILFQPLESIPLIAETHSFIHDSKSTAVPSLLVFGMNLFVESLQGYVWGKSSQVANEKNCRLRALRLANETLSSVKMVQELEKHSLTTFLHCTRAPESVNEFSRLLEVFLKEKCFDLYHQSPWVAGSQMSAILSSSQTIGLMIMDHLGILGSMLHLYNMLRMLKEIPELPVLEALCELFGEKVFMGDRPKDRFYAVYCRFLGGKMAKAPDNTAQHSRSGLKYMMIPPKSFEQTTSRILPLRCSHLVSQHLFARGFANVDTFYEDLLRVGFKEDLDRLRKRSNHRYEVLLPSHVFRHPLAEIVSKVRTLVEPEFNSGKIPISKLNCFKLYKLCVDVWESLATRYSAADGGPRELAIMIAEADPNRTIQSLYCGYKLQLVMHLDIEMRLAHGMSVKNHSALNLAKKTLIDVFGGKKVEDIVWEDI